MYRRRFLAFSLVFFIALSVLGFLSIPNVPAAEFNIVDYYDNTSYYIKTTDEIVTVKNNLISSDFYINSPVVSCSVYKGMFNFLCYTQNNDHYIATVYKYDFFSGSLDSASIRLTFKDSPYTFAADAYNRYYLTSCVYTDTLYCYSSCGTLQNTIKCNDEIIQILCIDGINVTVITYTGYYVIKDGCILNFEQTTPSFPCTYKGNGVVVDNDSVEYKYNNGNLVKRQDIQPITVIEERINQDTEIYFEDNYIFVPQGTTVAKLKRALHIKDSNYTVTNYKGKEISSGKIGSSATAYYNDIPYTIVVIGDITGEGNINSRDLKKIMNHLVGNENLDTIEMIAGDINRDNKICAKDIVFIMKLYE